MTRTDNDTWDLASSVGATATMVAAARAMATHGRRRVDQRPVRRTVGACGRRGLLHPLATGELRPEDLDADNASVGMQRMTDNMAVRTKFFDEFFMPTWRSRRRGHPAGGDPGVRPRLARVPAAVAGRHDGLRDRPARRHRVQEQDARGFRRRADRQPPDRRDGSALRLAVGTDRRGVRPEPADRLERRGPARLPAAGGPGPSCSTPSPNSARRQPGRGGKHTEHRPRGP